MQRGSPCPKAGGAEAEAPCSSLRSFQKTPLQALVLFHLLSKSVPHRFWGHVTAGKVSPLSLSGEHPAVLPLPRAVHTVLSAECFVETRNGSTSHRLVANQDYPVPERGKRLRGSLSESANRKPPTRKLQQLTFRRRKGTTQKTRVNKSSPIFRTVLRHDPRGRPLLS